MISPCRLPAYEVARAVGSDEPRSAVAAARRERRGPALLAEIYGWFTEGFDTKDLQEAKAVLEELR